MLIEIDFQGLSDLGLNINQYLTLYKLSEKVKGNNIPFIPTNNVLDSLEKLGYIVRDGSNIHQTGLTKNLFKEDNKFIQNNEIDFDELFEIYPKKTPNGRILRISNKERGGKISENYKKLYKKYVDKIKNTDLHKDVVEITRRMLIYRTRVGDLDFMNQLEVYLNQRGWEKYEFLLEDNSYNLKESDNTTKDNIIRI